jgi:hypothetical protein
MSALAGARLSFMQRFQARMQWALITQRQRLNLPPLLFQRLADG